MVTEQELARRPAATLARTRLPLLRPPRASRPIEAATEKLANTDWSTYQTYVCNRRPQQAELSAIRMLLALLREFKKFHLHIVHLSAMAPPFRNCARAFGGPDRTVETCPMTCKSPRRKFLAAQPFSNPRRPSQRGKLWNLVCGTVCAKEPSICSYRSFTVSPRNETDRRGRHFARLGPPLVHAKQSTAKATRRYCRNRVRWRLPEILLVTIYQAHAKIGCLHHAPQLSPRYGEIRWAIMQHLR